MSTYLRFVRVASGLSAMSCIVSILPFVSIFGCASGDAPFDEEDLDAGAMDEDAASTTDVAPRVDAPEPQEIGVIDASDGAAEIADSSMPIDTGAVSVDASVDHTAPLGVRCGDGASATYCNGSSPLCCQTTAGGGVTTYACATAAGCATYAIACAKSDDCPSAHICCHYNSGIKCELQCPDANWVCDPSAPGSCPSALACTLPLVNAGVTSPYMGCR